MKLNRTRKGAMLLALAFAAVVGVAAAPYPTKTLTFVAPSGAGGAFDTALRVITKALSDTKLVSQQMLVEAKPGGGGSVFLAEYVTRDQKNDHKLFLTSPTMLINNLKREGNSPFTYKNVTPLAQFFVDYAVIAVRSDSKYKDINSLFADMKVDPSKLSVLGGSGPGALDHLAFMLPANKAGVNPQKIKYISYDGKAEAMAALLGGNGDVLSSVTASVAEFVEAGKVRVLAVNASSRLGGVFKDVPTLTEAGIQADFVIWRGVFGPPQMSTEARAYWVETFTKLSKTELWAQELAKRGWDPEFLAGNDFVKRLDQQNADLKELLTALGMAK